MGPRTILHVDMDAFFASVEQMLHPEWRGRPVIVGSGPHERGVVSTCSYEARRFGVHSAMPSRTAYALCPSAVFVRPNMERYQEISARAFEVFGHFSPYVEGVSIDEAFLDITGTLHLYASHAALGEALRAEIRQTCGVTCSVGIAPNKLLAKIGSEQHKPDGLTLMPFAPEEIAAFLEPKPLRILWGIGAHTEEMLRPYGLTTCGALQRTSEAALARILKSEIAARELRDHAFGRSTDVVDYEPADEKSVSREYTFPEDCADRETVRQRLLELVGDVGRRFRSETRWANTARLKWRDSRFETFTRQKPFAHPARDDRSFRNAALALFDEGWFEIAARSAAVRLVGFGVTNIQKRPADAEPLLFEDPDDARRRRDERLSDTLDDLRTRGFAV